MTVLLSGVGIPIRQNDPPEGRYSYPLSLPAAGGGGGPITFTTGNEVFTLDTNSFPDRVKPSAILSMWVDASNVPAGKNLFIQIGAQLFTIAGGTPGGYLIVTPGQNPVEISITTNGGAGPYTIAVILYNYNVFFTGQGGGNAPIGAGSGGTPSTGRGIGGPGGRLPGF